MLSTVNFLFIRYPSCSQSY